MGGPARTGLKWRCRAGAACVVARRWPCRQAVAATSRSCPQSSRRPRSPTKRGRESLASPGSARRISAIQSAIIGPGWCGVTTVTTGDSGGGDSGIPRDSWLSPPSPPVTTVFDALPPSALRSWPQVEILGNATNSVPPVRTVVTVSPNPCTAWVSPPAMTCHHHPLPWWLQVVTDRAVGPRRDEACGSCVASSEEVAADAMEPGLLSPARGQARAVFSVAGGHPPFRDHRLGDAEASKPAQTSPRHASGST